MLITKDKLKEIGFNIENTNGAFIVLENNIQIIIRQTSDFAWSIEILYDRNENDDEKEYSGSVALPKKFEKIIEVKNLVESLK